MDIPPYLVPPNPEDSDGTLQLHPPAHATCNKRARQPFLLGLTLPIHTVTQLT